MDMLFHNRIGGLPGVGVTYFWGRIYWDALKCMARHGVDHRIAVAYGSMRFMTRWMDRKSTCDLVIEDGCASLRIDICREVMLEAEAVTGQAGSCRRILDDLVKVGHQVRFRSLSESRHAWEPGNPLMPCKGCEKDEAHHPDDADEPWLTVLCDGRRVKLPATR